MLWARAALALMWLDLSRDKLAEAASSLSCRCRGAALALPDACLSTLSVCVPRLNDVYGFQWKSLAFNRFAQGSSQLFERLRGCGVRHTVDQGIEQ